jgi:hypothetical protein
VRGLRLPLLKGPATLPSKPWTPRSSVPPLPRSVAESFISASALRALAACVRANPDGALQLLHLLRAAPGCVKHKLDDPYGPLALMVRPLPAGAVRIRGRPGMFPTELLPGLRDFNREWLARRITKPDLAALVEEMLRRNGVDPTPAAQPSGWRAISGGAAFTSDPLGRLFPL